MDAHAHLLSLGWAGPGHSLDSQPYKQKGHRGLAYDPAKVGNNGNGLVKPISISQRPGRFGIGKKAHEPQAGNEWWLKGFESALGNIGKSESERSSGTTTPITKGAISKHSGLYGFFIRGQEMQGTIGEIEESERSSKKRKSDALDEVGESTYRVMKQGDQQDASGFEQAAAFFGLRDKDDRRTPRPERPSTVDEFAEVGKYLEVQAEKKKKKKRKSEAHEAEIQVDGKVESMPEHKETKEERRAKRQKRKEEKQQRRKALEVLESQHQNIEKAGMDMDDAATKAARKAERKRKKTSITETR